MPTIPSLRRTCKLTRNSALEKRINAVEEILTSTSDKLVNLRQVLKGLPDLPKGLSRVQFGQVRVATLLLNLSDSLQCTPKELGLILKGFERIAQSVEPVEAASDVGFHSDLLNDVIYSLQHVRKPLAEILTITSIKRLMEHKNHDLWLDDERYPDLQAEYMVCDLLCRMFQVTS